MENQHRIQLSVTVDAPLDEVWKALTDPLEIKKYMFGADVQTDWRPGGAIVYTGEYEGEPYIEKGKVLKFEPKKIIRTTNYNSMSGLPDTPENYYTVSYTVKEDDGKTELIVSQDNIRDVKTAEDCKASWKTVLDTFKKVVAENVKLRMQN